MNSNNKILRLSQPQMTLTMKPKILVVVIMLLQLVLTAREVLQVHVGPEFKIVTKTYRL